MWKNLKPTNSCYLCICGSCCAALKRNEIFRTFHQLGREGHFKGWKCAESRCWFLWWAGGELGKSWRSGWTGVKAFRPLGALLGAKMLNSATLRLASLLKNEHVYSVPHPRSPFSFACPWKKAFLVPNVSYCLPGYPLTTTIIFEFGCLCNAKEQIKLFDCRLVWSCN